MKESNVLQLKDYTEETIPKGQTFTLDQVPSNPPSKLGRRSIAFGIDILSIMVFKMSCLTAYGLFINDYMVPFTDKTKLVLINGDISLNIALFITIYFSYFVFTQFILNGRTIGKLAMGLKTISERFITDRECTATKITLSQVMKRSFGYLSCYLSFGTFFLFNFTSEDKRGFADFISGSRTVDKVWLKKRLQFKIHCKEEVSIDIYSLKKAA